MIYYQVKWFYISRQSRILSNIYNKNKKKTKNPTYKKQKTATKRNIV